MFELPGTERAILSLILKDISNLRYLTSENVSSKHFSIKGNRVIFTAISHLVFNENIESLDSTLIFNVIADEDAKKSVEELGGIEYIDTLFKSCLFNNIDYYIRKLKETYQNRVVYDQIIKAKEQIEKHSTALESFNKLEENVSKMFVEEKGSTTYKLGDSLKSRLEERLKNPKEVFGYRIGWEKFDKISQGFQNNDCVVVVGESKTGKSTLLTNWTERLCSSGLCGLYIDTEMDSTEFEDRLVSIVSQVPFVEIRNGKFGLDTEYGKAQNKIDAVEKAIETIKGFNLYHEFMPEFTLDKVNSLTKMFKAQKDIDFLVFDYIKLPSNENSDKKEYERLGTFTTALKNLAGILKIPVITACQSNRSNLNGTDLDANSIQGSYRILQLASKLYFIRNKTEYELTNEQYKFGNQKLLIKYQRHGERDKEIDIQFDTAILKQREV